MDHRHVAVQADTRQEEGREVFDSIKEAQDVPGGAVVEEDQADQLQRRDEAEEDV